MKKYLLAVALIYAAFHYGAKYLKFDDTLKYAKQNKASDWAEPTDYYVWVIYYQRSEYPKAQEAFTQLLTDYPTGQYAARGLFMLGNTAQYNRDWETAKASLARYVEEFPAGADIELAKKNLELVRYQHGP